MIPNISKRQLGRSVSNLPKWTTVAAATFLLAACGGGGQSGGADSVSLASATGTTVAKPLTVRKTTQAADVPASRAEAARFLTQATFGPTDADIDRVMSIGLSAWIDEQFTIPATSHMAYFDAAAARLAAETSPATAGQDQVLESFWKQALTGPDQLRQRLAYALSQIFVVSTADTNIAMEPRATANWLDILNKGSFGTYRQLIEAVSLNPLMGMYLSSMRNQKADPITGRVPDENFARELMQLFSIGLVKLNLDGTPALVDGKVQETYGPADIAGLAKVFTGWSWACPVTDADCFQTGKSGTQTYADKAIRPMKAYPQFHNTLPSNFLGTHIGQQKSPDPMATMRTALDTLNKHSNTPPFISRQLIQRLTTSNPSPKYVSDVATVFVRNANGGRGDLKAVVKAILLHPEARAAAAPRGKVREPVLRLSAYLRAFPHSSLSGNWAVGMTESATTSLAQTPLRAPSVFNFYRPGYVAPGSQSAAAGLVAPELQLLNETSASGWINYMRDSVAQGVGGVQGTIDGVPVNKRDLQRDWSRELALAATPAALAASIADRLLYGQASAALQAEVTSVVSGIAIPAATATNQAAVAEAKRNRVNAALLLTLASPDFLVQK
jgi:uncharacterized protein (DUF1800 family)